MVNYNRHDGIREEIKQPQGLTSHEERERLLEEAKTADIFDVAQQLGLKPMKSGMFEWNGHTSFWLDRKNNRFQWYGQNLWGGPIELVSLIRNNAQTKEERQKYFRESLAYLTNTEFKPFDTSKVPQAVPFNYYLTDAPSKELAENYLKNERQLSSKTIRFFEQQGVLAQSEWRNTLEDDSTFTEPVVVFKHFERTGKMLGGSVQGIGYYPEIHTDHKSGHLKRVIKNSGAYSGLAVRIGRPERIVVCEAPIDLMSYYELHQDSLTDVLLISNDGYKPNVISKYMSEILGKPELSIKEQEEFLNTFDKLTETLEGVPQNLITFAYDNDEGGRKFVNNFIQQYPNAVHYAVTDLPPLAENQEKNDWNEMLQQTKKGLLQMETTESFFQIYDENLNNLFNQGIPYPDEPTEIENARDYNDTFTTDASQEEKVSEEPMVNAQVSTSDSNEVEQPRTYLINGKRESFVAKTPVVPLVETLPQQIEEIQEKEQVFLTKDELDKVLSEHFSKIEGLISQFKENAPTLPVQSPEDAQQEVRGLIVQIRELFAQMLHVVQVKVEEKKGQVSSSLNDARISVKNTLHAPLLKVANELKEVGEQMEQRFALEEHSKVNINPNPRVKLGESSRAPEVPVSDQVESETPKVRETSEKAMTSQETKPSSKPSVMKPKGQANFYNRLEQSKAEQKAKIEAAAATTETSIVKGKAI
ncbi:toprim domain-containing protein [Lactococcus nasutitermitis]|uniref:Toprim domain-containing protein n=1 Tax=Lactococcus nasutitermitis TaxID=1652957 RepID=A0ABV9JCM3_9LACT|nr:toprim domain-containing protein [Lactococcus nasutitermitis]